MVTFLIGMSLHLVLTSTTPVKGLRFSFPEPDRKHRPPFLNKFDFCLKPLFGKLLTLCLTLGFPFALNNFLGKLFMFPFVKKGLFGLHLMLSTFQSSRLAEGRSSSPPVHPAGHDHPLTQAMPLDFAHIMPASFFGKAFW